MTRLQMGFPKRSDQQTGFGGCYRTAINTILRLCSNQVTLTVSRLRKQFRSYLSLANPGPILRNSPISDS